MAYDQSTFNAGMQMGLRNALTVGDVIRVAGTDGQAWTRVNTIDGTTVLVVTEGIASSSGLVKGSADLALGYGLNYLSNASGVNSAYTLPAPPLVVGGEVTVALTTLSSSVTVIDNSTASTIGTGNTLTLTQAAPTAKLRAISTSRWERIEGAAAIS
jgi:hypothetical protein